jgi:hypothetical protein
VPEASCNGSAPYVWQIQTSNNQNRQQCTHLISKFKPATIKIGNVLENKLPVHTNTWWIFLELFREFFSALDPIKKMFIIKQNSNQGSQCYTNSNFNK